MTTKSMLIVACVLSFPVGASAQGLSGVLGTWAGSDPVSATPETRPPTAEENNYVLRMVSRLDVPAANTQGVRYPGHRIGDMHVPTAVGVRTEFQNGLTVQRLSFRDTEAAKRYALYAAGTGVRPLLIESRGHHIVVLAGEPLEDRRFTTKARRAAWKGLSAPEGSPEVLAAFLGQGDTIIELEETDPNFEQRFGAAVNLARRSGRIGGPVFRLEDRWVVRQSDLHADFKADGESRSLVVTDDPKRYGNLLNYRNDLVRESARLDRASPDKSRRHQRGGGQSGGFIQLGILPAGSKAGFSGLLGSASQFGQANSTKPGGMGIQPKGTRPGFAVTSPGQDRPQQGPPPTAKRVGGAAGGLDALFGD